MTFIRGGNYSGLLKETLDSLPKDFGPLSRVKVFTSLDQSLVLNSFQAGHVKDEAPTEDDMKEILAYAAEVQSGNHVDDPLHPVPTPGFDTEPLKEYMRLCTKYHITTSNPRRFLCLKNMYDQVKGTENCVVDVEVGRYCCPYSMGQWWWSP